MMIDNTDRALLAEIADGLPLVARPYAVVGARLGLSEAETISHLRRMIEDGVISRFGIIVNHRELGYHANAMVAWDIPKELLPVLGQRIAIHPFVTLCYERRRSLPVWPYNLYCMIHGTDRQTVLDQIAALIREEKLGEFERAVLFSKRCFKQRGAKYAPKFGGMKGAA